MIPLHWEHLHDKFAYNLLFCIFYWPPLRAPGSKFSYNFVCFASQVKEDTWKSDAGGGHLQLGVFLTQAVQHLVHLKLDQPQILRVSQSLLKIILQVITLELTTLSSSTLIIPAVAFGCTVPRSELSIDNFWQFWKTQILEAPRSYNRIQRVCTIKL